MIVRYFLDMDGDIIFTLNNVIYFNYAGSRYTEIPNHYKTESYRDYYRTFKFIYIGYLLINIDNENFEVIA